MSTFEKLTAALEERRIPYRVCEHIPEGRCEAISKIRGNDLSQAMKAIVIMGKVTKKNKKYYLAVVPSDKSIDMEALKKYSGLEKVMVAPADDAKKITDCEMGAVPPFSFSEELRLIADPSIKNNQEVVFNAGALDRSIFMKVDDYLAVAKPEFVNIIK